MKKQILISLIFISSFFTTSELFSQINTDQNGLKTSVTNILSANALQAKRYEIATVSYNSYHWQPGGLIMIELFNKCYGTGYEKYIIEIGYGQGAGSGSPKIKRVESHGLYHFAKVTLVDASDLSSSYGGFINKAISINLDVEYYSSYQAKITYLQTKVDVLTNLNQIKINENPNSVDISDFTVSTDLNNDIITSGNLRISGIGDHYIRNGNFGIGTISPGYKLDVLGSIRAKEIKVDLNGADFVFAKEYKLMPLNELEAFVKEQKHLPEVASAKEMQENGTGLGDLNSKLLQKIEELTLYAIVQNKSIKEQVKKNEELAKKIEVLEKAVNNLISK